MFVRSAEEKAFVVEEYCRGRADFQPGSIHLLYDLKRQYRVIRGCLSPDKAPRYLLYDGDELLCAFEVFLGQYHPDKQRRRMLNDER